MPIPHVRDVLGDRVWGLIAPNPSPQTQTDVPYEEWWRQNVEPTIRPAQHGFDFETECAMLHAWLENMQERLDRISPPKRKQPKKENKYAN